MAYVAISRVRLRKRLFAMYMVWFSSRPLYHLPANTPEKKNISNPASVLFLVKNLVSQKQKSENNEQKIVVVRVLVLLKKSSTMLEGKTANASQSINQSIS